MFRIQQQPTFWARVEFSLPHEPGKPIKAAFDVEFPRMTTDQLKELSERIVSQNLVDNDVARDLIKHRWRGVVDEQDQDLEVNPANVDRLLSIVGAGPAICKAFFEQIRGAIAKN